MPIGNNSGRIMSGYKKWLTKKQRSRLSGLYRGLRQSTADEMRDQYLDQRGSMNRVRDVASAYGLGEGYRARKQMTFDRAQERYGRQLAMQADNAFESEVVKAANESIQAENERRQKEYARRLKAAQNKRRAAQNKYNHDMAAYNEQQARLERLRSMKTPKTAQTWKAPVVSNGTTPAHVSPFSWQAHTLTQYTDTGTGNNSPKGGGKSGLIAAALLAGHTGKRLAKDNGTTKPRAGANNSGGKISGEVGRYTDTGTGKYTKKIIGRPEAPNFETDPSFALPLEPQMQAQLDVQLKEYQAATPEQQEQIKLGAKDQYAKDVAQYAGAMERLNTLQRGVQQAQSIMAQFQDLEAKIRNTRYSPEQRRGFSQQLSGLQRQYASVMQQQRGASQEISGLQRYIQNAFPRINASRALLGGMGIKYDIDSIAFDADWVRRGNQLLDSNIVDLASNPSRQSDRAKEFWKRADAIGIDTTNVNVLGDNPTGTSYTATGQRGSTISMTEPEREWFDANGFGNILRAVERDLQYNTQYASLGDAVRGYLQQYDRQVFDYGNERSWRTAIASFARMKPQETSAAIAQGEAKTGLTKGLSMGRKMANENTNIADVLTSVVGRDRGSVFVSSLEKKLDLPEGWITINTYGVMTDEDIAFIDYCFGTGNEDAARAYIYQLTEWGNAMKGERRAAAIEGVNAPKAVQDIRSAVWQILYGGGSLATNIKDIFNNNYRPASEAEMTASQITQNRVTERGWNPQFAQTFDSAMQSAGNNAAAFLVGGAIGKVGGALGGVAAKIASHAPGAIMGLSAAGQAKQQALREGYGAKAATMYGIFNGISETVLQENVGGLVGFGDRGALTKALTNAVNSVKSPVARTLINQGLDILSEIGEEEFGNIVENINRSVTLGEKRGLFDGFAEQAGETAVSTAISTVLLNALHIPAQLRSERGYSSIAKASGMSLKDAKLLLETEAAITNGEQVDPKDLSRYNELTAVLTAAMPENVAKAIADGKMTVADWVTSVPGMQRGMVTQKFKGADTRVEEYDTTDHTEQYKALEGDNEALTNLLVTAKRTGKVGDAYYVTVDGKPIEISKLSTTEVANYILAQKTAKALKGSVDIVIHDTLPSDNGVMLAADGSVHVALDAMNSKGKAIIAYKTLVHEVGHALKVSNPSEWNSLKSKLYNAANEYKNGKGVTLYDACAKAVAAEYNPETNPDLYDEELFCTVAQELTGGDETSSWRAFLKDETIFDMIAKDKDLTAKEKKTFLDKFKDSLSKMGKQFSKLGATKEERQFMKWHDSVMPEIEKAYKSINERESLVEKAAKNPGNKANIEAVRKQAEEDAEVSAIIKDLDAKDANIVAAIDGLSGEELTDEQFRALQRVIDKEEAEITPLGNPYNAEGVSPETMVEGTAVESQAQIPVKHSIKARNSIAQRTLETFHDHAENGKKRNSWKANGAITEDMLNAVYGTINEIAEEIEKNYAGKKDKNGMPLLPEETELNNNIFANSSYLKDAEPTSECYRQTIYFALNKMITDRLGRPATQKEAAIINQAAIEIGREAPCIYCYSLLDRKAKEAYKLQYLAERESFISALDERYHGDIEAFKKDRANAFDDLFNSYLAREFDPSAKDKKSSGKRKATEPQRKRLNLWLDLYEAYGKDGDYLTAESVRNPDAEIITRDELYNKYEGNELKLKERELTDIQTWIQDASQAKKVQTYAAYTNAGKGKQKLGGILSWSQRVINKLNREYGLRWYSHADYHPAFVIDNIQQITDASVRGLKGLMYCKPIEAAKIFAPTGMNINVSCFAKYVNGEYVVDDRLGANWAEVQKLREKYPNVGAVMVCTTEDMTMWALTQDWIDVVIPLHTVRSGSEFVEAFGLHDFSAEQADKLTDEQLYNEFVKKVCEEHDIRSSKGIEAVAKESKSIYPREHQNNYETYMAALNERGLTARFERIRKMVENGTAEYNGVKVTPEMYMKLVNETRQSDADTKPLVPNFDWDAARESIAQLPEKGYFDYFKDKVEIDGQEMDVNQLADRAAEDIKAGKNPNELGYGETLANPGVVTRQGAKAEGLHGIHHQKKSVDVKFDTATDAEYLSLAEKYRDGTATEEETAELEKRVEEAARKAGYNSPKLYHGTKAFGFTKIDTSAPGGDSLTFWAANRQDMAGTYSPLKKTRAVGSELNDSDYEEAMSAAEKKLDEDIHEFRSLIDEYFSEWFFGQQDDSVLRKAIMKANPEAGGGDGVYDVLVDIVSDAYENYGDNYQDEYDEFADFQEGFEFDEISAVIEKIEGDRAEIDDVEHMIDMAGIYELYANVENMLELDANGATWNNLRPSFMDSNLAHNTRRVARWAHEHGYDGVIFRNIKDNGQYGRTGAGDVYTFFNPTAQVKSADPVTYDDNGDIIPLSERFRTDRTGDEAWKNGDIRYQHRGVDAEYMEAVEANDKDWQLQLVVEAGYKAGYTIGAYHGSPFTAITRFDTDKNTSKKQSKQLLFGTHFTQNKHYAEIYSNKAKNSAGTGRMTYANKGRVYDVLLNLGKSLDLRTAKNYTPDTEMYQLYADMPDKIKRKIKAHTFSQYDTEQGLGSGNYVTASIVERCLQEMSPHDALTFLKDHGYNSVLYNANYNAGMANNRYGYDPSIIMLDAERIKSADPVTYDDNGDIIPLSERFRTDRTGNEAWKNEDIRYQQRNVDVGFNSKQDVDAEYMKAVEDGDEATQARIIEETAKKAFPKSVLIQDGVFRKMWHHTNKEFTSFLPGTSPSSGGLKGIYFTPQETSTMSALGNVHKAYYLDVENMKFAFGVEADRKYADQLRELQKGVTDREQLAEINRKFREETGIDAFFDWQNGWYNVLAPELIKSAALIARDDDGNIIPPSKRFDINDEDIRYQSRNVDVDFFPTGKKERKYSTEGVNAQGRNYASRREADARLAERMHEGAIRARIERKAGETEQAYKERIKKIYEDRYRSEIKKTALKWNKKLVDMLARPTENKHVPVQLARSVAEFCEEVTKYLDGTTKRGEKILDKIRKAYDRAFTDEQTILRAKSEDAGYDARGAVLNTSQKDEQLAEMLKELSEITAEKSFAELTRDEMDALLNVVRGVAYAVTDANKMIGEAEGKTVWQTGSTMIEQLENAPKVSSKLRGYLATSLDLRRLARIFSGSNEDAEFVKLVEQLNQGAIEKERVAQELQAIFKPVTDEYGNEIKKWYGKKAEWLDTGIVTKDGVPVKITKGMRVSLALHVLNEGNMRHIERGGLTIPDAKLYAQGKLADAYVNGKLVRLTAEQINDIIANMTEAEKAYVEAAKQLFHDRAGFYVNKTSLQLAGYTKANVENYFPIHTDENFNMTDFVSMAMNGSIEGQGFLQERKNASNPIYLEDITSVVNRQIRGVALYAGMAIPVRNFNAVMKTAAYEDENGNWVPRTTVKQTLKKTMGQYGAKVVEGFVEDASEMSQRVDVTPVERIAGKLATNYVKAVLLGNLKVAMKQVASYPTAAAVIPWKYLNKALVAGGRNHRIISRADVDLINKYTPLYQMRREGNANEVASLMNKPGMEQKLPWLLGWITKMDVMTVGRLWSAAEYMVEDTHKDLTKGSDEFYREVANVFNQTIQQTQPNFTPLQRSAALRSKNPIVRSLTLFGTQRMQNGGILIEAAYELKQAKGKSAEEIAAARRKLGRAVASQVTQNLLLLLATIAVDALRGRMKSWQDDDDELTLESIGKKMGDTFLSNILGSFLGGSEFYETVSNMYKKANGQATYDTEFSVPALDAIETIMSFGQSGIPNFINYLNGDHTDEEKLNKLKSFSTELAKVAGYATGLPLENAVKDVFKGFYPAYKDIRDWRKTGELIPYLWQSGKLDSATTRQRYETWLDTGHKGSQFFEWDKKLKGIGKQADRLKKILASELSVEDKTLLMTLYADTKLKAYNEGVADTLADVMSSSSFKELSAEDQERALDDVFEYVDTLANYDHEPHRMSLAEFAKEKNKAWVARAYEYSTDINKSDEALSQFIALHTYLSDMDADGSSRFGNVADYTVTNKDGTTTVKWNDMKYDYLQSLNLSDKERLFLADAFGIEQDAYGKAEAAVAEVPNLTIDAYTKALDHWQDLTVEKNQKKESLSEAEYEKWLAGNTNAFKKYLNDTKELSGQQKFALLTKIGSSEGWEGKANDLHSNYGVGYDDAWRAAYKASTLTSTDEASKNAQYMSYLNTTNLGAKQKFGLYGAFGTSTSSLVEKATAFVTGGKYNGGKDSAAAYGKPSYDALWNAYTAYNGGVQHEAFYDWLSKQSGMNAQQRFACCEFTNSTSAWMERAAEVNSKMGIGYDTLWKIKVYWRNESGQGKKARITAYCKKLGLRQSQVDKLYALKFLS